MIIMTDLNPWHLEKMRQAAKEGSVEDQYNLGTLYWQGQGVAKNDEKAKKYFEMAADQNHAPAQCSLGDMYVHGSGVVKYDRVVALDYYRLAAEQNYAPAQFALGKMYRGPGELVFYNAEVVKYFQLASAQGFAPAAIELKNYARDLTILARKYAQQDSVGLYLKMLECYETAANLNDASAQYYLGRTRYIGEKSMEYYKMAADQNYAPAQCQLGVMFLGGSGVKQNIKEAVNYFQLAAKQNYAEAQFNLGVMYEQGRGVKPNIDEAVNYFRLAAKQNHAQALFNLGNMYEHGRGVKQSTEVAIKYYQSASLQGFNPATKALDNLKANIAKRDEEIAKKGYVEKIAVLLKAFENNAPPTSSNEGKATVNKLTQQLNKHFETFKNAKGEDGALLVTFTQFKTACTTDIKEARRALKGELGWGDYLLNLIKNIANVVVSIFSSANKSGFFSVAQTEAQTNVKQLKTDLNQVDIKTKGPSK